MARRAVAFTSSLVVHTLALLTLAWTAARTVVPIRLSAASSGTIVVEPAVDLTPTAAPDDLGIRLESTTLALPTFDFDASKVIARAGSLFPFVMRRPFLEHALRRSQASRDAPLTWGRRDEEGEGAKTIAPALSLSDAATQELVDSAWSRRDRWTAFRRISSLANRYDADAGSVPALLRQYEIQNGLQPYTDTKIRDPRLWVELGLAADHADFLDYIARFAASHAGTAARTELLFLLDKIVQASFDALVTLLDVVPDEDLQWTHDTNAAAYDAIVDIQRFYVLQLQKRDLGSRRALSGYYDDLRMRILADIVETTPGRRRVNDALYQLGAILWKQGRRDEAIAAWRRLGATERDDEFAREYSQLADIVRAASGGIDAQTVDRILRSGRGRWLSFSATRLRRFGYHFDTY